MSAPTRCSVCNSLALRTGTLDIKERPVLRCSVCPHSWVEGEVSVQVPRTATMVMEQEILARVANMMAEAARSIHQDVSEFRKLVERFEEATQDAANGSQQPLSRQLAIDAYGNPVGTKYDIVPARDV